MARPEAPRLALREWRARTAQGKRKGATMEYEAGP